MASCFSAQNITRLYENFGREVTDRGLWKDMLPEHKWISAEVYELVMEDVKVMQEGGAD